MRGTVRVCVVLAGALVGCAQTVAAPSAPPVAVDRGAQEAQRLAEEAEALARAGAPQRASATWSRAVALDPDNAELAARVGAFELGRSNTAWGLTLVARAARLRPDAQNLRVLAHALAADGQAERAASEFGRLFEMSEPGLVDALRMVELSLALSRLDEATSWASRAVDLDESSPEAHVAVGQAVAANGGSRAELDAAFERARALAPGDASIPARWAALLVALDGPEAGIARLTEAIARLPEAPNLLANRIGLLAWLGRCAEATTELVQLRENFPDEASRIEPAVTRCQPPPLRRENDPVRILGAQSGPLRHGSAVSLPAMDQ